MKAYNLSNPHTNNLDFPHTAARTADTGNTNGTVWNADFANEIMGFFQAALIKGNRTPNGANEESGNSQVFNSIVEYARKPDQRKFKYTTYFFNNTTQLEHRTQEKKMSLFYDGETAKYVFDEDNYLQNLPVGTNRIVLVPTGSEILSFSGARCAELLFVVSVGAGTKMYNVTFTIKTSNFYGISPTKNVIECTFPDYQTIVDEHIYFRNGYSFHPVSPAVW